MDNPRRYCNIWTSLGWFQPSFRGERTPAEMTEQALLSERHGLAGLGSLPWKNMYIGSLLRLLHMDTQPNTGSTSIRV